MSAQNFQNYGFGSSNFLLSEDLESRTAAPAPGVKPRRSSIYAGAERIPMKIKKQPEEDDEEVKYMQKLQASMSGYFKNKQPPAVQASELDDSIEFPVASRTAKRTSDSLSDSFRKNSVDKTRPVAAKPIVKKVVPKPVAPARSIVHQPAAKAPVPKPIAKVIVSKPIVKTNPPIQRRRDPVPTARVAPARPSNNTSQINQQKFPLRSKRPAVEISKPTSIAEKRQRIPISKRPAPVKPIAIELSVSPVRPKLPASLQSSKQQDGLDLPTTPQKTAIRIQSSTQDLPNQFGVRSEVPAPISPMRNESPKSASPIQSTRNESLIAASPLRALRNEVPNTASPMRALRTITASPMRLSFRTEGSSALKNNVPPNSPMRKSAMRTVVRDTPIKSSLRNLQKEFGDENNGGIGNMTKEQGVEKIILKEGDGMDEVIPAIEEIIVARAIISEPLIIKMVESKAEILPPVSDEVCENSDIALPSPVEIEIQPSSIDSEDPAIDGESPLASTKVEEIISTPIITPTIIADFKGDSLIVFDEAEGDCSQSTSILLDLIDVGVSAIVDESSPSSEDTKEIEEVFSRDLNPLPSLNYSEKSVSVEEISHPCAAEKEVDLKESMSPIITMNLEGSVIGEGSPFLSDAVEEDWETCSQTSNPSPTIIVVVEDASLAPAIDSKTEEVSSQSHIIPEVGKLVIVEDSSLSKAAEEVKGIIAQPALSHIVTEVEDLVIFEDTSLLSAAAKEVEGVSTQAAVPLPEILDSEESVIVEDTASFEIKIEKVVESDAIEGLDYTALHSALANVVDGIPCMEEYEVEVNWAMRDVEAEKVAEMKEILSKILSIDDLSKLKRLHGFIKTL